MIGGVKHEPSTLKMQEVGVFDDDPSIQVNTMLDNAGGCKNGVDL